MPEGRTPERGLIPLEDGGAWLLIDKPAGMTSHDVLDRVRRITGEKKAGHAGTLDPMATGLLVIALGKATRKLAEGLEGRKRYLAAAQIGLASPTGDRDADWTVQVKVPGFAEERVRDALAFVRERGVQVPPMVSALKRFSHKMYKLARRGWWLEREPRTVEIDALELTAYERDAGRLELDVTAGGGFYVRTLVQDIGAALGVPASLTELRRLEVGPFRVDDAVTLDELEQEPQSRA